MAVGVDWRACSGAVELTANLRSGGIARSVRRRACSLVFTRASLVHSIDQIIGTATGASRRLEPRSSTSSRPPTAVATSSWWTTSPCRRSSGGRSSVARSNRDGGSSRRTTVRDSQGEGVMGSRADGATGSRAAEGKDSGSASRGGTSGRSACFRSRSRWVPTGSCWETRFRCRL